MSLRKMGVKKYFARLAYISIVFLQFGCKTTQIQTAKTLDKGEKTLALSLDSWNSPLNSKNSWAFLIPIAVGLEYNWGTRYNLDHSISYHIQSGASYSLKKRLYSSNNERFYFSTSHQLGFQFWAWSVSYTEQDFYYRPSVIGSYFFKNGNSFTYQPFITLAAVGYLNDASQATSYRQKGIVSHSFNYHFGKSTNKWVLAYSLTATDDSPLNKQLTIGKIWRLGNN